MTDDTQDQAASHLPPPLTLSEFSRRGGRAGTGQSKRRTKEHYQAIARARWAKAAETAGTTPIPPPT